MSDWRPIETAPKDGTSFLAYFPSVPLGFEDWSIVVCWWNEWSDNWDTPYDEEENPTHWMPLPPTPN